jgi:chemotaxis protein CheD
MNSGIVVGIGEYAVSKDPESIIKTFALGSCVAVIMYDRIKKVGGLLHVALPDSKISSEKSEKLPGYFADTGMPILVELMIKNGAFLSNTWIKLIGGANVLNTEYNFDIGTRNALAIKKILWKNNLGAIAEDLGGNAARTCMLHIDSGKIIISSGNKKWEI